MHALAVPSRRTHRAALAAVLLLASGALLAVPSPAFAATVTGVGTADAADTPTTTVLVVEPGASLEPFTPATLRAVVSPADALGIVTFAANGAALGSVPVAGGQAVIGSNSRPAGDYRVTASFEPTPGSRFFGSSAAPVQILVNPVPRVTLFRDGGAVPPGTKVNVGEPLTVRVQGFPPQALVTFTLGAFSLPTSVTTNEMGTAAAAVPVPRTLPSSVYQLSASGGKRSAGFVFYVYNPPAAAAVSAPTGNTGGSVPATTPTVAAPGTGNVGTSVGQAPPPSSGGGNAGTPPTAGGGGGGGTLPQTGGDPARLLLGAALALGMGSVLTVAGRPRPFGAHSRP